MNQRLRRALCAILVPALMTISFATSARARGDCDCCVGAKHYLWEMTWCDTYPARAASPGDEAAIRAHYEGAARALSMAIQLNGRMLADSAANYRTFRDAILHLTSTGSEPFRQATMRQYVRHPDSLLKRFTSLVPRDSAPMLTVQLGSYPSQRAAEAAARRKFHALTDAWGDVRRQPAREDTWTLTDCSMLPGWEADLFVLGPQSRREHAWRVLHGLYYIPAGASAGLEQARERTGARGRIVPIEVTAGVIRAAREWAQPEFERKRSAEGH